MEWFHINWEKIQPVLPFIHLIDNDFNPISGEVQQLKLRRKPPTKIKLE